MRRRRRLRATVVPHRNEIVSSYSIGGLDITRVTQISRKVVARA
jgi:hypothetical protein